LRRFLLEDRKLPESSMKNALFLICIFKYDED